VIEEKQKREEAKKKADSAHINQLIGLECLNELFHSGIWKLHETLMAVKVPPSGHLIRLESLLQLS
jgi:hypothetical protein